MDQGDPRWSARPCLRTVGDVELAPPPADAAPAPAPPPPSDDQARVLGGVAALLAGRLGIDALWLRLGFVILSFVGGLGLVLYAGCWLAFVVGADAAHRWARVAGAVVLLLVVPLLLGDARGVLDGPLAVVALFLGLAVALWKRDAVPVAPPPPPAAPAAVESAAPAPASWRWTPRRGRRAPSILGRSVLGVAVLVAAVGALIDGVNGGRLHPEQWLGAAAVVCGLGLLVGTVAGRAWWLVVPAAVFAGSGFVAGEAARLGIEPTRLAGDEYLTVDAGDEGGWVRREHLVLGSVDMWIHGAPRRPVTVDARVAVGDIRLAVARDVTVEVRAEADHGDVFVRGIERPDGTVRLGPEGDADVVVIARVGVGSVHVSEFAEAVEPELPYDVVPGLDLGTGHVLAEGVLLGTSGHVVLVEGEAVIGPADDVLLGERWPAGDGITVIPTSYGEYRLLRGGLLLTPDGDLLDLPALRAELGTVRGPVTETTAATAETPAPPGEPDQTTVTTGS
jgi:phage shock protein PspC (stress-responsive transcriptional regulator)